MYYTVCFFSLVSVSASHYDSSGIVQLNMKSHYLACGLLCIGVALYIVLHTREPVEFTSTYIGQNIVALGLEHLKSGRQFAVFSCGEGGGGGQGGGGGGGWGRGTRGEGKT